METVESKVRKLPLQEQGPRLPIGVADLSGQQHCKDFNVRPWRLREERELGALFQSQDSKRFGRYVALILAHMCLRIGPHDFEAAVIRGRVVNKKLLSERLAIIDQMYLSDVLFLYLWLRVQSLGKDLPVDLICPRCREKIPFIADLHSLDVRSVDTIEDAEWQFGLKTPVQIREQEVGVFAIRPPRWSALGSVGSDGRNFGELKASVIHSSVYTVGDMDPSSLAPHEFDEMTKLDFETLTTEIDNKAIGPDFMLEVDCPGCGRQIRSSIEWASEDFFGVSSRLQTTKT